MAIRTRTKKKSITNAGAKVKLPTMRIVDIDTISVYENNPRHNETAINEVMQSMVDFGFRMPIVVDGDGVIIAGHTRYAAATRLNMPKVPVILADDLTEDQVRALRIIDNKTAELATWDTDKLAPEIRALVDTGLDLTLFGWHQEEIDCLADIVAEDCLSDVDIMPPDRLPGNNPTERRAPNTTRFVFGSVVFFISQADYKAWEGEVMAEADWDNDQLIRIIKNRLGIQESERV